MSENSLFTPKLVFYLGAPYLLRIFVCIENLFSETAILRSYYVSLSGRRSSPTFSFFLSKEDFNDGQHCPTSSSDGTGENILLA